MSDAQYTQYLNIQTFATKWRGFKPVSDTMRKDVFAKNIQFDSYVLSEFISQEGRKIYIYLFIKDSRYTSSTQEIKKILIRYKNPCALIFITEHPFSAHINKVFKTENYNHLKIYSYRHKIFNLVMPDCPLNGIFRIMTKGEVVSLLNDNLKTTIVNLSKIYDDDPQCIWIGAQPGDIIEISTISLTTQYAITYKLVAPRSGRIIVSKNLPVLVPEDENENAAPAEEHAALDALKDVDGVEDVIDNMEDIGADENVED